MKNIRTVVFDLDGTLIDSSASILAGFAGAFAKEGRQPTLALRPEIIGPPLKETLALLAGSTDLVLIDRLAEHFKAHYDTVGYRETTVFDGVNALLAGLSERGIPLHIATNKRLGPTIKILDHLGWRHYFGRVVALDAWTPPAANKAAMIGRLVDELKLEARQTLYVGDRNEDALAATANGLPFAFAAWGYGVAPSDVTSLPMRHPSALLAQLDTGR